MTELPANLTALLDRARIDHDPSEADRERVLGALTASLALGGAATVLAQAPTAGAQMAATSSVLPAASSAGGAAAKWWLIATLAAGAGAGTWTAWPESKLPGPSEAARAPIAADVRKTSEAPGVSEQVAASPSMNSHVNEPAFEAPAPSLASFAEPSVAAEAFAQPRARAKDAPSARAVPQRQARVNLAPATRAAVEPSEPAARAATSDATSSESATPTSTTRPSNQRELTLIRGALTALRDGQPNEALALLAEHARSFPRGTLADQRAGLRVVALCEAGQRDQGTREQHAFLANDSSSALAQRVRRACAPGSTP